MQVLQARCMHVAKKHRPGSYLIHQSPAMGWNGKWSIIACMHLPRIRRSVYAILSNSRKTKVGVRQVEGERYRYSYSIGVASNRE